MLKVSGTARLGKDCEVKEFGESLLITTRIISSTHEKRNGEWGDFPVGLDATIWVRKTSKLSTMLKKGQLVEVHGNLAQETWGEGENKQYKLLIKCEDNGLIPIGGKPASTTNDTSSTPDTKATPKAEKAPVIEVDEDEIPF